MDRESIIKSVVKVLDNRGSPYWHSEEGRGIIDRAYDLVLRNQPLYARPPRYRNDNYFFQEVLRYIRVYYDYLKVWC